MSRMRLRPKRPKPHQRSAPSPHRGPSEADVGVRGGPEAEADRVGEGVATGRPAAWSL